MRFIRSFLIIYLGVFSQWSVISWAAEGEPVGGSESYPTFDSAFQAGVKNYQEKKYSQSILAYQKSLNFDSHNVAALTNLALAQFQNGQKAWSVALLRKALNIDPRFSTAQDAYNFIWDQFEVKEIPHDILMTETLRAKLLIQFSLFWFSSLAALFLFASGWSLIGYFGKLKKSKTEEQAPPSLSFLSVLFSAGALLFISLMVAKAFDQMQTRATVISNAKVSALSSPDASAPALFDLYPGLEVIIKKTSQTEDKTWMQINYPGGATGWLNSNDLYVTSEN